MIDRRLLLAVPVLCLVPAACIFVVHDGECDVHTWHDPETTQGSRVEVTEQRTVAPFQRIEVAGSIDVDVDVGGDASAPPQVSVRADDNLIKLLRTDSSNGTLTVRWEDNARVDAKISPRVRVQVPMLERISITGSGDATVRGLNGAAFQALVAGSGDVTLKGRTDRATVTVSGSGDVRVSTSDRLEATVTGSGYVRYRGNPKDVERSVAGSGSVERDSG